MWRNIPDNSWGRILTQRLDWGPLRPAVESSRLCSPCRNTNFLNSRLELDRSLGDLSRTSEECPMCCFLLQCLSKRSLNWNEMVKLSSSNDEHTFLSSINGVPAISLYFDPGMWLIVGVGPEANAVQNLMAKFQPARNWDCLCFQNLEAHSSSTSSSNGFSSATHGISVCRLRQDHQGKCRQGCFTWELSVTPLCASSRRGMKK